MTRAPSDACRDSSVAFGDGVNGYAVPSREGSRGRIGWPGRLFHQQDKQYTRYRLLDPLTRLVAGHTLYMKFRLEHSWSTALLGRPHCISLCESDMLCTQQQRAYVSVDFVHSLSHHRPSLSRANVPLNTEHLGPRSYSPGNLAGKINRDIRSGTSSLYGTTRSRCESSAS